MHLIGKQDTPDAQQYPVVVVIAGISSAIASARRALTRAKGARFLIY